MIQKPLKVTVIGAVIFAISMGLIQVWLNAVGINSTIETQIQREKELSEIHQERLRNARNSSDEICDLLPLDGWVKFKSGRIISNTFDGIRINGLGERHIVRQRRESCVN